MNARQRGAIIATALAALLPAHCGNSPPPAEEQTVVVAPEPAEVAFFYARPAEVVRGEDVTICYSTEAADQVTIDPPIRDLHPSISYCFHHAPTETETYTLTAQGDGGDDSAEITVKVVGPSEAQWVEGPIVIRAFTASSDAIRQGERVSICYILNEAQSVELDPTPPGELGLERYCFATVPQQTTTYTLRAVGNDGHTQIAELTVEVQPVPE